MKQILTYLAIINAAAFLLMLIDKRNAIKGKWRIPKSVLMGSAAIGGTVGALLGMYIFRHKTKHKLFTSGIPFIMLVHIFLILQYLK